MSRTISSGLERIDATPVADVASRKRQSINPLYYLCRAFGRFVFFCTMRVESRNAPAVERAGPFILAPTHISHLEPFCASILLRRQIDWMTRKEFFIFRPVAWFLHSVDAFIVNRQGVPVSAIRTAINRIAQGRVVGICPEGGVAVGARAAVRGGAIKRGCCSVSIRSQSPIIPCVILGTHALNCVGPWLPFRRAKIWVAFGEPIYPSAKTSNRQTRAALAEQLSHAYQDLYHDLCQRYDIPESFVP